MKQNNRVGISQLEKKCPYSLGHSNNHPADRGHINIIFREKLLIKKTQISIRIKIWNKQALKIVLKVVTSQVLGELLEALTFTNMFYTAFIDFLISVVLVSFT